MSEKRVAPPDGGSGDLVLIQRHLENLSAGEILEELDARMEEMTDQSCDPELIRLYLDVLEEKEPLGLELDPEASLQRFLEERAGEESRSTPPEEPAAQAAVSRPAGLRRFRHFPRTLIAAAVVAVLFGLGSMAGSSRLWESVVHLTQGTLQIVPPGPASPARPLPSRPWRSWSSPPCRRRWMRMASPSRWRPSGCRRGLKARVLRPMLILI